MESNTIEQMNEVIAEFMGYSHEGIEPDWGQNLIKNFLEEAKYHSSWDWLMPVWFKFVDLKLSDPMHQLLHSETKAVVGYTILYGDIEIAHRNIFDAIQWYNQNKNQ